MRFKPKEILVNLPAVHLFAAEDEIPLFASTINTIVFGKVKIKYEILGTLGEQIVGLFYIQRNNESQQLRDEFMSLIMTEEESKILNTSSEERCSCGHFAHTGSCLDETYNGYSCQCKLRKSSKVHDENCGCKSCVGM